jgi:hypothetical protein
VLGRVRLGQLRRIRARGDVAAVHDLDRLRRAHDADPGVRPGHGEIGSEIAGVHHDVRPTIRLAQRDGYTRGRRDAERAQQ